MPTRPPRACSSPGCAGLARSGARCEAHALPAPDLRASAARRGYDRRWREIRAAHLARHPACVDCRAIVPSPHVDHVDGNPRNRRASNLATRCPPCHARKTARHDGSFGRPVRRLGVPA